MPTLSDILAIEDDPELLSFRCPQTGWVAWPAIRHDFLGHLIFELAYRWPALAMPPLSAWQRRGAAATLLRSMRHNAAAQRRGIGQRPIMIFASAGIVPWNGRALNRLSDHFALATPGQAAVWENLRYPDYKIPRDRINADVFYTLPYLAQRYAASLHRSAEVARVAAAMARHLSERTRSLFDLRLPPERIAALEHAIATSLARYPVDRRHFERLFARGRPRLIILEEACYGHLAPVVLTARAMGIPVAEYQHGFITRGYRDYNFAPALLASAEYRATLPDIFLSYGTWWNDRFNAPVDRVVIGNPHRSEILARMNGGATARAERADVVVLAKADEAERYLALATALDACAGGKLRIVFRAKPSDLTRMPTPSAGGIGSVIVDTNTDVYATLTAAEAVVGGPSTTLLEGLGIAKRIFMWDDAAGRFQFPEPVFERFIDAADLYEKLRTPAAASLETPVPGDVWASGWKSRYQDFIARYLR